MAERLRRRGEVAPRQRVRQHHGSSDGYFYPREVASILKVEDIDYAQLRRLYRLIRKQAGLDIPAGWSRFTFDDLVCLETIITLCGGKEALREGRRLQLGNLKETCEALRRKGFTNPLLQVTLDREGRSFVAVIDDMLLDPNTDQTLLTSVGTRLDAYLARKHINDPTLVTQLSTERRKRRQQAVRVTASAAYAEPDSLKRS